MRLTRVYVDAPLESGARVTLVRSAASHVTRVLRLRCGNELMLFNGRGGEYTARIDTVKGGEVTVAVGEARPAERESPLRITLAQGISRGERMDFVVQKATELGLTRFAPLYTQRSIVRLDAHQADRKLLHWRAVATAACEQCGRNRLPEISPPAELTEFVRAAGVAASSAAGASSGGGFLRLLLSPTAERRIGDLEGAVNEAIVLVGPEGGLADAERDSAAAAGFAAVQLGPRVLRTETAAIAALTLLQREFGDL
jgi:16S rRNA (uracil1498-N3)-methyltransferase